MVCALEQQKSSDSNYVGSFYWEVKIREHNDTDIHHCSCTFCVLIFGSLKYIEIGRFNWSTSAPKYCRCIAQWNLWKLASLKMPWMYLRQSRIWVLVNKSKLQVIYIYHQEKELQKVLPNWTQLYTKKNEYEVKCWRHYLNLIFYFLDKHFGNNGSGFLEMRR